MWGGGGGEYLYNSEKNSTFPQKSGIKMSTLGQILKVARPKAIQKKKKKKRRKKKFTQEQ